MHVTDLWNGTIKTEQIMASTKFELKRTIQCAKCPWKKSTNPHDIPGGYSEDLHHGLSCTISDDSAPDDPEHCIGWLHNQLGAGNNIGLRIKMMSCSNIGKIKIVGEQHNHFNETLPDYD